MDTFYIPNESDFRRWIKEALRECLESTPFKGVQTDQQAEEPLLTRKEIAGIFRVSLVTLHDWMKRGLPSHKQGGRVYFLRSEVMEYVKQNRRGPFYQRNFTELAENRPDSPGWSEPGPKHHDPGNRAA